MVREADLPGPRSWERRRPTPTWRTGCNAETIDNGTMIVRDQELMAYRFTGNHSGISMASGGTAVLPLPPRGSHDNKNLLPTSRLVLWSYTDMSDPRWGWGAKYIRLQQDPKSAKAQKIGAPVPDGWAAYCRQGNFFLKLFPYEGKKEYPDFGSSTELFTNADILELETLGPLLLLEPGKSVDHTEDWFLFDNVPVPAGDSDIERMILPKVELARRMTLPPG